MKTIAIVSAIALAASSTFALTLFKDLNMDGNAISNVGGIKLSEGAKLENVASIQFASGQVMSNTSSADIRYPDGYDGEPKLIKLYNGGTMMYTVTVGKTLYVTSGYADGSAQWLYASTNGVNQQQVWYFGSLSYKNERCNKFTTPMAFPEKTVLKNSSSYNLYLTGIEVPQGVEVCVLRLDYSSYYTVPTGKKLYVMSGLYQYSSGFLQAQQQGSTEWWNMIYFHSYNNDSEYSMSFNTPLVFDSGVKLRSNNSSYPVYVTGYLK